MRLFLVATVGLLVVFAPTQSANARAGRALGLARIVKAGGPAHTTGAKPSAVPQGATATRGHP